MKRGIDLLIPVFIFFLGCELLLGEFPSWLISAVFFIAGLGILKTVRYNLLLGSLPFLLVGGIAISFPFTNERISQQIWIIFSIVLLYLALSNAKGFIYFSEQKNLSNAPEKSDEIDCLKINQAISFITFFLWTSGIGKAYLNFNISVSLAMILLFVVIIFLFYQSSKISNPESPHLLFYSLVIGFMMTELAWTLSFWPLEHFSIGATLLVIYWFWWDILGRSLKEKLNKKIIFKDIIFGALGIGLILLSTKWLPC